MGLVIEGVNYWAEYRSPSLPDRAIALMKQIAYSPTYKNDRSSTPSTKAIALMKQIVLTPTNKNDRYKNSDRTANAKMI